MTDSTLQGRLIRVRPGTRVVDADATTAWICNEQNEVLVVDLESGRSTQGQRPIPSRRVEPPAPTCTCEVNYETREITARDMVSKRILWTVRPFGDALLDELEEPVFYRGELHVRADVRGRMPVVRLEPTTGAVLGSRDGDPRASATMPDLGVEVDALSLGSSVTIRANGDVALFHGRYAELLRVEGGAVVVQTFATPSMLNFVDTGAAFVGTTDQMGDLHLVVIPWPSPDAASTTWDLVLQGTPGRLSVPAKPAFPSTTQPALLETLERHAGTVAIPADVRALFAALDADPELHTSLERLSVTFDLSEQVRSLADEIVLLWASPYDDNLVGLDRSGKLVRAFRPSEDGWTSAGTIGSLLGEILVDAAKAATADFVVRTLDRAKVSLPKKVRKAFKLG